MKTISALLFGSALLVLAFLLLRQEVSEPHDLANTDATQEEGSTTGVHASSAGRVEIYNGISVSSNVKTLDLSGQELSGSLKAEVRNLTALTSLNLSNNNFTGLPAEVGQLSNLTTLNLSNNPLTGLPLELGNLQNLRVLDLRGTNYSEYDLNIIQGELSAEVNILTD